MRRISRSPAPGTIISKTTRDGQEVVVRYLKASDAPALHKFINALSEEKIYLRHQGERVSLPEERKYVARQLGKIKKKTGVHLLLFVDGELAGGSSVDMKDMTHAHVGRFGIALTKSFRGRGLGPLLMKSVLAEAAKLPGIRIVELELFGANKVAHALYRKMGFREYGKIPGGVRHRGRYVDEVFMYKKIKK
jgi:RimJ/RimL family protein N-acetyltransferase